MKDLRPTLEARREEYLQRLKELIAIDTRCLGHGIAGGQEKAGQEYLYSLLQSMGADELRVEPLEEALIQEGIARHNEGNPGHVLEERWNLHARFKGTGGPSLLFNGHMDTMPPDRPEQWRSPPHAPEVREGRLYGLGSADMKSGLMAAVLAVKLIRDAGEGLPGDVCIASVADEEGGGNGSIVAALRGAKADGVVVCEPSSDELILAHMGFVFFRVRVEGRANHSGAKWKGVSAIDKAIKLIAALNELEHGWLLRHKHPLLPPPNLNVGVIRGGSAGSTVAGDCLFEICVHYLPRAMRYESVRAEVEGCLARAAQGDAWLCAHPPTVEVYQAGGAFEQEAEQALPRCFRAAYRRVRGRDVAVVGSPAGCDSRTWKNIAGCPTLQFGPGRLEECHAVDEYVEVERFFEAILIYAELIRLWGAGRAAEDGGAAPG